MNSREIKDIYKENKGARKFAYLDGFKKATVEVNEYGETVLTGYHADGDQVEIIFKPGYNSDAIAVNVKNNNGCRDGKRIHRNRVFLQKNNTAVQVNELIYQFTNLYLGKEIEHGEFCHCAPVAKVREIFGYGAGRIAPAVQNQLQQSLFNKILADTGWVCAVEIYGEHYSLGGLAKITEEDMQQYEQAGLIKKLYKEDK